MKASVPNGKLTCEYLHQGVDTTIKGSDALRFLWKIEAVGYCDTCETKARCNSVVERGVPFPDRWKTALNCLTLSDAVAESNKNVTELGASSVNYTKHRAQSSTQLLKHHLGEVLWFPLCFMVTFLWSSVLKVYSMRPPSWKLPQIKTDKHAISRICSIILR